MRKQIKIELVDPEFKYTHLYASDDMFCEEMYPRLCKQECKNILKEAKKINISTDELINAIVAEMYERNRYKITIDIDGLNKSYEPAKEMTLSEIEAALGYKVKIVNENQTQ